MRKILKSKESEKTAPTIAGDPGERFRFWKETVQIFFFNLHYVLMLALFTLVTFLPLVTAGGGIIALSCSLRTLAENGRVTPREYFRFFAGNWIKGLWLDLAVFALAGSIFLDFGERWQYFVYFGGVMFLQFLTLYFPNVCYAERRWSVCIKKSVYYLTAHIFQALILVSFAYLLLILLSALSSFLLCLFYPVYLYACVRAVQSNNGRIEAAERNARGETGKDACGGRE